MTDPARQPHPRGDVPIPNDAPPASSGDVMPDSSTDTTPEWLARRLERTRSRISQRGFLRNTLFLIKRYSRAVSFIAVLAAGTWILTTYRIMTSVNAPLPPGIHWTGSGRMLINRRKRRASDLERFQAILYEFMNNNNRIVRSVGIIVGLPGDTVSFRPVSKNAIGASGGDQAYSCYVNGERVTGEDNPAFALPLYGRIPPSVAVSPGHVYVLNPALGGSSVDSRGLARHQIPDAIIHGRVAVPVW